MGTRSSWRTLVIAGATLAALAHPAIAQDEGPVRVVPTNHVVLTGYGTVGYVYQTTGENVNAFTASLNPVFLWQFQDRVLFEAEFEFALEGGVTETGLEYAQLDMILHNNITGVAGKFLLPFGVFGERLHPTWINKFPTSPPIYGHHVATFGAEPLLPILADVGVMGRGILTPGAWSLALNVYITQGPVGEVTGPTPPELELPGSSGDNNSNKMVGGRLDIALPPWVEVNFSAFTGKYDDTNVLDFTSWNIAAEFRKANFELRGEFMQTRQEFETLTGFPTKVRDGFYAQVAYRFGAWEPVARWTQVFDTETDGIAQDDGAYQVGFGLNFWFTPSMALMVGYELNREDATEVDNDRLVVHLAFGF